MLEVHNNRDYPLREHATKPKTQPEEVRVKERSDVKINIIPDTRIKPPPRTKPETS